MPSERGDGIAAAIVAGLIAAALLVVVLFFYFNMSRQPTPTIDVSAHTELSRPAPTVR